MDTPEVPELNHRGRPRRRRQDGLPRWLEMAVAVTALITSISSIVLAIGNGNAMDKLVKANSIPYLLGGFSDVTPEGTRVLSLDLVNNGVGPAHEKSLRVKVHGRYVLSTAAFLNAVLGSGEAQQFAGLVTKNGVRTRFIRGGATQMVFRAPRTPSNASAWERLRNDENNWDIDYCYCSVFDECWRVSSVWNEPQPVKQCTRDPAHEFMP
jgi:hypothetical protein